MMTKSLRWLTVVLPVLFVLSVLAIRQSFYATPLDWWVEILTILLIIG